MASSQPSQNVEMEAAKFLQKLIQESKDEPAKLAMKLYVILQHMKSSGKEHSMPYQVISRAMETVINQHGLDIEALKSSRLPLTGGPQVADSSAAQHAGSSQAIGVPKIENEISKSDPFASSRPPLGSSSAGHDYYQGSGTHRSSQSFDHESPSSLDTRSANSQSQERGVSEKDGKKAAAKRKRGDSSLPADPHNDNPQQLDARSVVVNPRKVKMNKVDSPSGFTVRISESNAFNAAPNSGYLEVSSAHVSAGQQLPSGHESFSSSGVWNQSKAGLPLERSQVPRFTPNAVSGNMTPEIPLQQSRVSSLGSGAFNKVHGGMSPGSSSYQTGDLGFSGGVHFNGFEHQKRELARVSVTNLPEKAIETNSFRGLHGDDLPTSFTSGKGLDNNGGTVNIFADANKIIQGGRQNSNMEMTMMRTSVPRDTGKSPVPHVPASSGLPFNEQQLKQLRAQCLVFLAFRNGLMPKKLHLEIALGNIIPKDGGRSDGTSKELIDHKGKAQSSDEPNSTPDGAVLSARQNNARESDRIALGASSLGRLQDANSLPREGDRLKMEDRTGLPPDLSVSAEERKNILPARKLEAEMQCQEAVELQASCMTSFQQPETGSARRGLPYGSPVNDMENGHMHVGKADQGSLTSSMNKQVNTEAVNWSRIGCHNEVPQGSLPSAAVPHNLLPERRDNASIQFQDLGNSSASAEQDDEDNSASTDSLPPPKYTMSEKWIMCHQRKRVQIEQNWLLKQQKTKQRIATCFEKLKENVSSSEDISAKTKSVIELKKLQLLELQHRLRSDFLNDFFKPVTSDMDRLKSFKKHKHGRRIKQLEKFEQKMKEERQKRIRERQKEFFAEIEVHKERLEDVFKTRRERWKGFNKYVKEFHKRKERIHREKIDRIQREKINLLKINDVEGYLRMVQDVKSDRVKQLLKETEKYLQKLGSKLQEAKAMATQFENDMDETRTATFFDKNEFTTENEDESDQAKHYLESNEKYYMMAHSIKESIAEQPTCLLGGKLREYQMNGLRWLVSLYNNHLNGILADEMGLGKTVQVISLICYLMETKNDRGPFLVVVPSSVLPGWESEINFWAPGVHQIVYSGPPEERRRLFKEKIVHQKFNVLLTTYEYLMNKHDRPKLSKLHWHYIIIDEGHRIKNASCKLNADLKHYRSSHRLLLTGTPLQNNLEELWALLNFLLPNIFNSSEDFSQWFNKPFESNGDSSADEALLSEEENLLIINRLHQVLRPFVLRRLKHKVENQLPEKIERLIRCEASAYQKLLMKRVEENLGSIGNSKARSIHNSVMELRNICNHPYLSQLHAEEVDNLIPKHFLPPMIRLCGKLEMLDRLLPKLKATDHRVLFFSTMTRLLDIMEEYLSSKQYPYLRLDGHTSGGDRGALIDLFNGPNSPYFIFLLSIRAGGVGVNLQAADTVIIFDTDWNPQVDLQAQARAHRIGQKKDVLVLRFETVQTVEEQVRASAEHKLGVANQSITAGFFDNNTSAEDRREYLESLLRECKKEEAAPVLGDDALNDLLARSESEIDVFESVDKQRREREMATWKELLFGKGVDTSEPLPPPPSRLVTDDDLKAFYEAMKLYDVPKAVMVPNAGAKRKGQHLGGLDTRQYGRGKRAREVRSYEEQWTEEEFDKMCQVDPPDSPKVKEEVLERNLPKDASVSMVAGGSAAEPAPPPQTLDSTALQQGKDVTPPSKRGRGRPRRVTTDKSPTAVVLPAASGTGKLDSGLQKGNESSSLKTSPDSAPGSSNFGGSAQSGVEVSGTLQPSNPSDSVILESQSTPPCPSVPVHSKGRGRKAQSGVQVPRRRGKKQELAPPAPETLAAHDPNANNQSKDASIYPISVTVSSTTEVHDPNASHQSKDASINPISGTVSSITEVHCPSILPGSAKVEGISGVTQLGVALDSQSSAPIASSLSPNIQYTSSDSFIPVLVKGKGRKAQTGVGTPRRRGRKQATVLASEQDVPASLVSQPNPLSQDKSLDSQGNEGSVAGSNQRNDAQEVLDVNRNQKSVEHPDDKAPEGQCTSLSTTHDDATTGSFLGQNQSAIIHDVASVTKDVSGDNKASSVVSPSIDPPPCSAVVEGGNNTVHELAAKTTSSSPPMTSCPSVAPALQPNPSEAVQVKRQGRKAPSRAEAPRRRGKKQSLVSPAVDALGLDPKSNLLPQNKSRDSPRSKQESDTKELINVVQEANLPSGLGGHDQKRKETIGIPTFGRIPTADVTDVARVMKEIFSESSKTKFGDSSRNEGKSNIPNVAVPSKMPVEVGRSQSSDGNTYSGTPSVETAAPVIGDSIVYPKQSGSGASVKMEEINSASLSEVPISQDDALKSENKTTDVAVENLGESREASSEISVEGSSIEVCAAPLNTGVEGVSPQELAPEEAVSLQPSQGEADTPGTTQNDCVNESVPSSEPSLKLLPLDTSSPVCAISDKVNYAGDNSTERPSVSAPVEPKNAINETEDSSESSLKSSLGIGSHVSLGIPDGPSSLSSDHSGSKSTHGGSEISPGISNEPSSKESLNPPLDPCSVYPSLSCMKPNDLGDHPEVSASLPSSLYHSGVVEPSGQTRNTSGIEIQPPVKESPEPCAIDSESPERPIVSRSSDGLGDHPPVLMSFSGSEDHSVDVALDGGCPGMRAEMIGEATIESPEASQKVNDLGPDVAVGDVASTDNVVALHETSLDGDRLGGQSCGTEDKRDTLPEPQQGATSEFVTESISKSADSENVPLAPGSAELGCLTVCSMEVGATEVQIPSPKDKIEDDNSGVSSVQEERSSKVIISEPVSVEKDLEVCPGTESVECEIVEACKGRAELSEAPTSSSKGITAESANAELIPDDHAGIQYQSMDESEAKSVAAELGRQMDGPNIGGIILQNISEYSLPSSSEVSMEENVDDLSKKGAESSPLLENVLGSELNTGNQDENVPTESEHMVRPSSLFLEGEVKENDSREKFAISVGPEGSEGSDLNMINHKDVSHFDVAVLDNRSADVVLTSSTLETEEEKVKGSIEQGLVCSNIPDEVRGSEAEDGDGSGVCQINSMVPEEEKIDSGVSENNDLPSSYIAIEEEKIEGSSEMDPLSSSIAHMKSEGSEAELVDQIDASGAGVLVPENTSESMVSPLSSSPLEKQIIEGASEKDFIDESEALETSKNGTGGSVVEAASGNQQYHDSTAEESKRSEIEEVDQAVSSQVDGTFPETASAQTVLPLSSSAMEEEKTQLLSESSPHGTSVALEESEGLKVENIGQRVGSQLCEVVTVGTSEDMGLVSSSPTKTFEGLPEENQRGIQVAVEEVKKSGTEVGDLVFASHAGGTEPQDNEVNDVGPGNSAVGGICIEDASGKVDLPSACLGMLEESRNVNQPLSSSAMQEEKNEDPPQKIDEPITPVAEVDVQAHSLEAGLENMSGNKVLPSASLRNEERNGVSGNVQFGHLEPPIDSGDNSVLPSSSLGNEEKIDATSKNVHSGSSESPIDSGDNSVLPSSFLGNEEKIDETSGNFLVSSSGAPTDSADNPVLPSSPHVTERNISVASDVGGPCAASEGDSPGVASSPQATEHKVDVSTDVGGPPEASEGDNSVLASSPQATKEKVDVSADVGGPPEASEGDDRVVVSPPQATEQKVDASTDVGGHCEGSEKDNSVLLSSPQATEQQVDVSADAAGPSAAPEGSEAAGGDKIKCFEVDGIEQENTAEDLGKHSSSIAPADERAGLSDKDPVNSELEPEESPESVAD